MVWWLELVFLVLMFVLYPIYDWKTFPKHREAIERGVAGVRLKLYREIILVLWLGVFCLGVISLLGGRSAIELGLGFEPSRGAWIAVGLVLLITGELFLEQYLVRTRPALREKAESGLETMAAIVPTTEAEWRRFILVALTAGFCEEVLFRGFLFLWLQERLGMPAAAVLSCLMFGAAHAYQGITGMVKTALVGGLLTFMVWLGGSLWPAIVLHAIIDLVSGRMSFRLFQAKASSEGGAP